MHTHKKIKISAIKNLSLGLLLPIVKIKFYKENIALNTKIRLGFEIQLKVDIIE